MSIFSDINPNTTSGNQLATILNSFKDSFASGNIGAARDANLVAGGNWIDNTTVVGTYIYNLWDGTIDQEIFRVNTTTGIVSFPGGGDNFALTRESDDSIGSILSFLKKRASGSKATQDGDTIGEIQFTAFSDTSTEELSARIKSISEDAATASIHGSNLIFETTAEASGTLIERMRIDKQGNLGLGTITPEVKVHVHNDETKVSVASDDAIGARTVLRKSRLATSGQVLLGDVLGEYDFESTDDSGDIFSAATVKAVATENHTAGNRGTKIVIESVQTGGAAKAVGIEVDGVNVTIAGQAQGSDIKSSVALLDDTVTRNLVTVDGATWKSFFVEVNFWGRSDIPETRAQSFSIRAVYDTNTASWHYSFDTSLMTDTNDLIDLAFTNGQNLVIDYVNLLPNANFVEGRIEMELRRIA